MFIRGDKLRELIKKLDFEFLKQFTNGIVETYDLQGYLSKIGVQTKKTKGGQAHVKPLPPLQTIRYVPIGVPEFDALLKGGLTENEVHLFYGEPGSGKTITSLTFLANGVLNGERAIYACFDADPLVVIRRASESLGLPLKDAIDRKMLFAFQPMPKSFSRFSQVSGEEFAVGFVENTIKSYVEKYNVRRLVFDPITPLVTYPVVSSDDSARMVIMRLVDGLRKIRGLTTIFISEALSLNTLDFLKYVVDTVIKFNYEPETGDRWIIIEKRRWAETPPGRVYFEITGEGIKVVKTPRIRSLEKTQREDHGEEEGENGNGTAGYLDEKIILRRLLT